MKRLLLLPALAALSAASQAVIFDIEPTNNTMAGATPLGIVVNDFYVDSGDLSLTKGDVDFFSINLGAGQALSVISTPLANSFTKPDTTLELFDSMGNSLAFDDDSGPASGSLLMYNIDAAGTYFIKSTASPLAGPGLDTGKYQFTVSVSPQAVPEPASMAALGLGAFALIRRRNGAKR